MGGMYRNAKIISAFTLVSRIFGYLRDLVIARYFGTSIYTDMFFIAFRMPNSFRRLIGEGAMNSAVVPVLSSVDEDRKPLVVWNLVFVMGSILLLLTLLGLLFPRLLITVFSPGYLSPDKLPLMKNIVRITFPYLFFVGLYVLFMGILNSYNRFAIAAFAPTLLNISIIVCVLLSFHVFKNPVYALCLGALIGGVLQALLTFARLIGLRIRFVFYAGIAKETSEILRIMIIAATGGLMMQLTPIVDALMASFMPQGSFSYLYYANRLYQLPYAVFSLALTQSSIVDFSRLSNKEEVLNSLNGALKLVSLVSITVTLYFLFFGFDVIRALFEHGKFSAVSAKNTYWALVLLILGFFFQSQSKLLANVFYSHKDPKTPLRASSISAGVSVLMAVLLGYYFGFRGLAFATTLGSIANMFLLAYFVNRRVERGSIGVERFFNLDAVALFVLLSFASLAIKRSPFGSFEHLVFATALYSFFFFIFYKKLQLR